MKVHVMHQSALGLLGDSPGRPLFRTPRPTRLERCALARTTHRSGLLSPGRASRRIHGRANGRRVSLLAMVSLGESHSIIWGNSGAEPAPLLTGTHEAYSSGSWTTKRWLHTVNLPR